MVEEILLDALDIYIDKGHENEKQLAQLAKDLIVLTGDQALVVQYINEKAALSLEAKGTAW